MPRFLTKLAAFLLAALALLPLAPRQGAAQSGSRFPSDGVASVEILPGWREGAHHVSALRIKLAPGWKTYWRAPGDAGIPPEISWQGSENLAGVQYVWPTPEVFYTNGQRALGYRDELVLPVILTPARPGQAINLAAELDLGVCRDVCVPVTAAVRAEVPAKGSADPLIRAALTSRALSAAEAGLKSASCRIEPIRDGLQVTAALDLPALGGAEVVVIEAGRPGIWSSEALVRREGRKLLAQADLVPPEAKPFSLDRSKLRITVVGAGRSVEIEGCPGS